MHNSILF